MERRKKNSRRKQLTKKQNSTKQVHTITAAARGKTRPDLLAPILSQPHN